MSDMEGERDTVRGGGAGEQLGNAEVPQVNNAGGIDTVYF